MTSVMSGATVMDMQYNYTAGANNRRITSSTDGILNETVNYTYDTLNRLVGATATNGAWGQSFAYDGFGNLTYKSAAGAYPAYNAAFDPATNWQVGVAYDANGNPTNGTAYDVENRLIWKLGNAYAYDYRGKRLTKVNGGTTELYLYGTDGRKLATYQCTAGVQSNNYQFSCGSPTFNTYWKGKLVKSQGQLVTTDRLGSVRWHQTAGPSAFYPYGEERTNTADDREKFGTYMRDDPTQDYADQRYYGVGTGRFFTSDPSILNVTSAEPRTWNLYSYANGDPINGIDPNGRYVCGPNDYASTGRPCPYLADGDGGFGLEAGQCLLDGMPISCSMIRGAAVGPPPADNQLPDKDCVQAAITSVAQNLFDLSGFQNPWVQIVGTTDEHGGPYGETELNMTAGDLKAMNNLVADMCSAGFYNNGTLANPYCTNNAGSTKAVGPPHDGFVGNFRAPGLTDSLQVNINFDTLQVQMDIDRFNPAALAPLGAILHGVLQVAVNKMTGTDNSYGCLPQH
jgi:RHS repeat-associated protein